MANPGSDNAIANGCTCNVIAGGNGIFDFLSGFGCYVVNKNCPIHGIADSYEQNDLTAGCCDMGQA